MPCDTQAYRVRVIEMLPETLKNNLRLLLAQNDQRATAVVTKGRNDTNESLPAMGDNPHSSFTVGFVRPNPFHGHPTSFDYWMFGLSINLSLRLALTIDTLKKKYIK